MDRKSLGSFGESAAAEYLEKNNYKIVQRNFRFSRLGEIDIIAWNNGYLCFIEVKTRSGSGFGFPSEAVGYKKQMNIKKLAWIFMSRTKNLSVNVRFDIMEVYVKRNGDNISLESTNLIINAF